MAKVKPYVMTEEIYEKLERKGCRLVCERCGKDLKVGDVVLPRRSVGRKGKTKRYHKECWEKMFFT